MNKNIIEVSGTKNKIEIDSKSISEQLNWDDAKKACEKLGEGWRLPTNKELYDIYFASQIMGEKIGDFVIGDYWSSTEISEYFACSIEFESGVEDDDVHKENEYYVCAVRDSK
jgi:hypothetical protein